MKCFENLQIITRKRYCVLNSRHPTKDQKITVSLGKYKQNHPHD